MPEITTPLGNVSVSGAVRFAAVLFALLKVMVRVEAQPVLIVAGLKALPSVGAMLVETTVKVAMAGAALLPLLVCKAPAAIESMKLPPLGAVTCTFIVQEP